MEIARTISELRDRIGAAREKRCKIGCVPTMGALHAGHLSLVAECRQRVDYTVLTIFVNPTQFAPTEDLSRYPRPLEADLTACRQAEVDCVYLPEIEALYPSGYDTWVEVDGMSRILEGEYRPMHFRGVTTIVAKLFNIVQPDVACFGAKDYQQQTMLRKMVQDLNFPIEMVICPTLREPDGLAMSSRNVYLSPEERQQALVIFRTLQQAKTAFLLGHDPAVIEAEMRAQLQSIPNVSPQYAVLRDPETLEPLMAGAQHAVALIAAKVGETRLIDNLTMTVGEPI